MLMFMICKRSQAGTQWAHQALLPSVTTSMQKLKTLHPRFMTKAFIWAIRTPGELGTWEGP